MNRNYGNAQSLFEERNYKSFKEIFKETPQSNIFELLNNYYFI